MENNRVSLYICCVLHLLDCFLHLAHDELGMLRFRSAPSTLKKGRRGYAKSVGHDPSKIRNMALVAHIGL